MRSAPADAEPPRSRRRRRWPARTIVAALLLAGAVVSSWPVGNTFVHNYLGSRTANATDQEFAQADPESLLQALEQARRYNAALGRANLVDPWGNSGARSSSDRRSYLSALSLFGAMGTITIPAIGVHLPIYHDTTPESLAHGVGHFLGSSLPVGGAGTHAVLAGHSGMSYASLFDRLPDLRIGDRFMIRIYGALLTYQVDQIVKVLPDQLDEIAPVPGKDYVTLVTCVPRLVNTYRLLVRGVRVPNAPSPGKPDTTEGTASGSPNTGSAGTETAQPEAIGVAGVGSVGADFAIRSWMIPRLASSLVALGILALIVISWILGDRRRRGEQSQRTPQPAQDDAGSAPRGS